MAPVWFSTLLITNSRVFEGLARKTLYVPAGSVLPATTNSCSMVIVIWSTACARAAAAKAARTNIEVNRRTYTVFISSPFVSFGCCRGLPLPCGVHAGLDQQSPEQSAAKVSTYSKTRGEFGGYL